ncbi:MAG: ATP-dependent metallopeptidase FtsH/Yme1/Tma family protein [Burkholderiales bacterium]
MEKKTEWNVAYWIVAIPLFMMLQNWWSAAREVEPVPYSEFERYLKEGKVSEVWISDLEMGGRLKSPDPNGKTVIAATPVEADVAALDRTGFHVLLDRLIGVPNAILVFCDLLNAPAGGNALLAQYSANASSG